MVGRIRKDELASINRIRNAERQMLSKINDDPVKWNSESLRFKIKASRPPILDVQLLKTFSELKLVDTFYVIGPDSLMVGEICCYKNFDLSFECQFDLDCCIEIGNWFDLIFSIKPPENGANNLRANTYILQLRQDNGLFSNYEYSSRDMYNKTLNYSLENFFSIGVGQWHKEIWTIYREIKERFREQFTFNGYSRFMKNCRI